MRSFALPWSPHDDLVLPALIQGQPALGAFGAADPLVEVMNRKLLLMRRKHAYPMGGESLNAGALVWSNAPLLVGAHDTGPLIRSKEGFWLAIPTPAAGKSARGGRITPDERERRTDLKLRFILCRRAPTLLVAEGRLSTKGRAVASRAKTGRRLTTVPR